MDLSNTHKNCTPGNQTISVVMSIYNEPEAWLIQSIDSILNQTYTDFEFIIINDNPERELNEKLLHEFSTKDERINIIRNSKNIGLTKSLNIGFKAANGKYIARMDGDDISLQDRLMKQYSFLQSNEDYIACGTFASCINEFGRSSASYKIPATAESIYNRFAYHNSVIHPTLMIKKSALEDNHLLYNEEFRYSQDYELIGNLLMLGKIANIPEILLKYRISNKQISTKNKETQIKYADSIRINFILKNSDQFPFEVTKNDFTSWQSKILLLKKIEKLNYNNSESFLKYVSLSLLTNFNAVTFASMLTALGKNEYTNKNKLKVIRAYIQELLSL